MKTEEKNKVLTKLYAPIEARERKQVEAKPEEKKSLTLAEIKQALFLKSIHPPPAYNIPKTLSKNGKRLVVTAFSKEIGENRKSRDWFTAMLELKYDNDAIIEEALPKMEKRKLNYERLIKEQERNPRVYLVEGDKKYFDFKVGKEETNIWNVDLESYPANQLSKEFVQRTLIHVTDPKNPNKNPGQEAAEIFAKFILRMAFNKMKTAKRKKEIEMAKATTEDEDDIIFVANVEGNTKKKRKLQTKVTPEKIKVTLTKTVQFETTCVKKVLEMKITPTMLQKQFANMTM